MKHLMLMMTLGLGAALWAELPAPYIHWKMDALQNGVVRNAGTNTDARCDLAVGAGTCVTNIQGFGDALFFDAVHAPGNAWGTSWSPGVRSRTVSFWIYRPATDDGINATINKAHYILNGYSYMNVMAAPGNGVINVKVGLSEGTATEIAHTYFYSALNATRGSWHHMVMTLKDTGNVEEKEEGYVGMPIYEFCSYLDGVPNKSELRTLERVPSNEGVFTMGNNTVNGTRPLPGALGDVRFYDTALSANEVHELFRERLATLDGELVAWYPMDAIDESGAARTVVEATGKGIGSTLTIGSAVTATPAPEGAGLQFNATGNSWGQATLNFAGLPLCDHTVAFWMYVPRGFEALCGSLCSHMARVYVWGTSRFMFNSNVEYSDTSTQADLFLFHDNTRFIPTNAYLEKGSWAHVAIAVETACDFSSGTASYLVKPTIYADGVKAYEGAWTVTPGVARFSGNTTLFLANNGVGGTRGLYGALSDFRVYRGALSSNEVAAVYGGVVTPDAGTDFAVARETAELRGQVASRKTNGNYGRVLNGAELGWELVSAPAGGEGAVIETPAGATTRVTLPVPGDYTFRLTATTAGAFRSDEVTVTRLAAEEGNLPPTATADATLTATAGVPVELTAVMADADAGPGTLRGSWKLVSGAGGVWFDDAYASATTATFSSPGDYVIRFTADDGLATAAADVAVSVTGIAADPASTLTNGLIGYWPIGYGALKDMVTGTAITRDFANTTLSEGLDGNGFRGTGKTSSLITGCNMREDGTNGNRPALPEGQDTVYRSFSFWMYHDTVTPNTNETKCIALVAVPYALELNYNCEAGLDGNNRLFQMWQQSGKDTDGSAGPTGGGSDLYFGCPAVSPANRWMHVYVAFDRYRQAGNGNDSQLWIDGVKQIGSGYAGYSRVKNDSGITFAGMNASLVSDSFHSYNGYFTNSTGQILSRTFPGWIDEIRMYDRLLDENEIKYLAAHPFVKENRGPSVGLPNAAEQARIAHKKPLTLTASVAGYPLPTATTLTYEWRVVNGEAANVAFVDATARETSAVFARAGSYAVQLVVSDGEKTTYSDPLVVEVPQAGTTIYLR